MLKRYFFTGLALLLPAVVTVLIVMFFVNLLTKPFLSAVQAVLRHTGLLYKPFLFLTAEQTVLLISKILIVITLVLVTIGAGFLTQLFAARYLMRFGDYIIHQIPIVNKIYKAAQDVVQTVFREEKAPFRRVVLVRFPHENSYSIGLITSDSIPENSDSEMKNLVSVFLPATPNPTMGFMLLLHAHQFSPLEMNVEDALKAIISCGVILPKMTRSSEAAS